MSFEWHKKLIFACLSSLQSKRRVIEKVAVTVTFQWSRCRPFPVITALRLQQHCMLETTINNIKQKFLECNTTHISLIASVLQLNAYYKKLCLRTIFERKNTYKFLFWTKSFALTSFPIKILQNYKFDCFVLSKHFYFLDPRQTGISQVQVLQLSVIWLRDIGKFAKTWHSFPLWWIRFCFGPMVM